MAKKIVAKKTTSKTSSPSKSAKALVPSPQLAALPSNVVRVPKPARASFDPGRPVARNTLIKNQIEHFHKLELEGPPDQRTGVDFETIKTEGEASDYIRKMTAILHPKVAKTGGK